MRADKLGDALTNAGYHPRDVEFDIAIAKYLNSEPVYRRKTRAEGIEQHDLDS